MYEVVPIVAGVGAALVVAQRIAPRWRMVTLVALSLLIGFTASAVSGELSLSWGFVPVDVAEVLLAAGLSTIVLNTRRTRARAVRRT